MVANGDQLKPLRRGPGQATQVYKQHSCGHRCAGAPPANRQGAAEGERQGRKVLARSESRGWGRLLPERAGLRRD